MRRRPFLAAVSAGVGMGTAGCFGVFETRELTFPPVLEDRPDGVYFPTHLEEMAPVGVADAGLYRVGVSFSYPTRFWHVNGTSATREEIENRDDVHLMATVWEPETGTVIPDAGVTVEISRSDELVTQEVLYPMLSQQMGVHYGDNLALEGEETYEVTVTVGGLSIERRGRFDGRFETPATATVSFDYSPARTDSLELRRTPDRAGTAAAAAPMAGGEIPVDQLPPAEQLPGRHLGSPVTDDAVLATVLVSGDTASEASDPYLAVSARTPYRRYPIPGMELWATVHRSETNTSRMRLQRALSPDIGYHYGSTVENVRPDDRIELVVETPAQVARHEGYETAFLQLPAVTV